MNAAATTALGFLTHQLTATTPDRARRGASYLVIPPPLDPVRLAEIPGDPGRFRVAVRYDFTTPWGQRVTIPAGYQTDLASSPKLLWLILAPHELGFTATTIHDFLCDHGAEHGISREEADDVFAAVLELQRVNPKKAAKAVAAVRFWSEFRKREAGLATALENAGKWASVRAIFSAALPAIMAAVTGGKASLIGEAVKIATSGVRTIIERRRARQSEPPIRALVPHEPISLSDAVSLPPA